MKTSLLVAAACSEMEFDPCRLEVLEGDYLVIKHSCFPSINSIKMQYFYLDPSLYGDQNWQMAAFFSVSFKVCFAQRAEVVKNTVQRCLLCCL
ncbi:hypothetical protein EK904_002559 [Melospiza melodia maxima]|nr:hypothetical protein EK904_002559 [Melospiza melodia maxima]